MNLKEQKYWTNRYTEQNTGWDIGYPSTPIKNYIDQLENKDIKVLIPGAGNAYEAEYIYNMGFKNVFVLDISEKPLIAFRKRNPNFPKTQILHEDFFNHSGTYDLVIEQTFFCSFIPTNKNRTSYATKMAQLLKPKGRLVGLWFNFPLTNDIEKRPFGGNKELYQSYLNSYFKTVSFENCYNSIPERTEKELFGIFKKRT
ncbi:SAM-dependent methyltransferase [Winogradskyella sp. PC-19]|uniref:methyltransferase domain-containing protein n=1 Tax=unclassified Winogradskyella TaxID=2615021 RepID=UPI000B3C77EA|nr:MULTISPECIES: methyltransferase domain-containing protein [unclassified Winogradskyella]ARV10678.1 SAM-dependent methyltransferase [Winogradskyella sp. PC-19]